MENMKILIIGAICLLIGIYLVKKKYHRLKELKSNDMLFVTSLSLFLDGILFIGIGIVAIVFEIIQLF